MFRWSSNSKLIDQVACGGQLSRVDMANDHNGDVRLLLIYPWLQHDTRQINSQKKHMERTMVLQDLKSDQTGKQQRQTCRNLCIDELWESNINMLEKPRSTLRKHSSTKTSILHHKYHESTNQSSNEKAHNKKEKSRSR
jgi:hypothetical protein